MRLSSVFALAVTFTTPAFANDFAPQMQAYLDGQIRGWSGSDVLVDAIRAQNTTTTGYSQDQIDSLDQAWRAEVGASSRPTIDGVLNNAASEYLRGIVEAAGGVVSEVILMDARGLNVAVSDVTSDYWQGDEAKHSETYGRGPDGVHLSEVEFDESSQTYQGQISVTIVDPASGEPVGALTVGVNAEALF